MIIDTPPSLCWLTESALIASDYSLVCTTPEFYSVKGLERLGCLWKTSPTDILYMFSESLILFGILEERATKLLYNLIDQTFPGKLFNTKVRRDVHVSEASIHGKPIFDVAPKCRAAEDYKSLTKELLKRM